MKDLVSKTAIVKPDEREAEQESELLMGAHALAERMLFGAEPRPQIGPPRIILGLDCTTSMGEYLEERRITPEMARTIADALFANCLERVGDDHDLLHGLLLSFFHDMTEQAAVLCPAGRVLDCCYLLGKLRWRVVPLVEDAELSGVTITTEETKLDLQPRCL